MTLAGLMLAEFPIPTTADVVPMMPGALAGAALAIVGARMRGRIMAAALLTLAAILPWVVTWAWTHGGAIPGIENQTSTQRVVLALMVFAVVGAALPVAGRQPFLSATLRWIAFSAGAAWVLKSFLNPDHPAAIDSTDLAVLGAASLAPTAIAQAAPRLHPVAVLGGVSALASALGLLLVGASGAAALSQGVASTGVALGVTVGLSVALRVDVGRIAVIAASWVAAGSFGIVDAAYTADAPVPLWSLVALGAGILVPSVAARIGDEEGARSLRHGIVTALVASVFAAGSVGIGIASVSGAGDEDQESSDPYGGLDAFK